MGRYILKQPNGYYCVWSSISDAPICWNATRENLYEEDYLSIMNPTYGEYLEKMVDDAIDYGYIFEDRRPIVNGYNYSVDKFRVFLKKIGSTLTVDDFYIIGYNDQKERDIEHDKNNI